MAFESLRNSRGGSVLQWLRGPTRRQLLHERPALRLVHVRRRGGRCLNFVPASAARPEVGGQGFGTTHALPLACVATGRCTGRIGEQGTSRAVDNTPCGAHFHRIVRFCTTGADHGRGREGAPYARGLVRAVVRGRDPVFGFDDRGVERPRNEAVCEQQLQPSEATWTEKAAG